MSGLWQTLLHWPVDPEGFGRLHQRPQGAMNLRFCILRFASCEATVFQAVGRQNKDPLWPDALAYQPSDFPFNHPFLLLRGSPWVIYHRNASAEPAAPKNTFFLSNSVSSRIRACSSVSTFVAALWNIWIWSSSSANTLNEGPSTLSIRNWIACGLGVMCLGKSARMCVSRSWRWSYRKMLSGSRGRAGLL